MYTGRRSYKCADCEDGATPGLVVHCMLWEKLCVLVCLCLHLLFCLQEVHITPALSVFQIDDFLAGKSALSVAIRLGESVVVVNLNRAKVEEIEVEPPEEEEKCTHAAMVPAGSTDSDSGGPVVSSSRVGGGSAGPLNTNPRWSPLPAHCKTSSFPASKSLSKALTSSHTTSKSPLSQTSSSSSSSSLGTGSGAGGFLTGSKRGATCASHPDARSKRKVDDSSSLGRGASLLSSTAPSPSKPTKIQLTQSEWEELQRLREIPTSQNGVSMKRKAVMEAIGEILKKMYAQRARGKIPGSFKGRFSSEFTCDSDMREIIHSKTTMTSCGDSDPANAVKSLEGGSYFLSDHKSRDDAKSQENLLMRNKVAQLRLKMQQTREERRAKRKLVDRQSPCDWMEEDSDCMDSPPPAKMAKKSAFCGLKPGFLLQ